MFGIKPKVITDENKINELLTRGVDEVIEREHLDKRLHSGEKLRIIGGEFGATTGRPRRCGWLDIELLKFACYLNGFTQLAITKLDVLDNFPEIKICTHYTLHGKKVTYLDGDANFLAKVKPIYKTFKGWSDPTKGVTKYNNLPKQAKEYIKEIEKLAGVKIRYISTGPKREEIIKL